MKNKILAWIQGPRNYYEGVAIYQEHGYNKVLKQRFQTGKSELTTSLLFTQLCHLADISEEKANRLPRKAKTNEPDKVLVETKKIEYADDTLLSLMIKLGIDTSSLESEEIPEDITSADETIKTAYIGAKKVYADLPETTRNTIKLREEFPFLASIDCPTEIKLLVHDMFTEYDKYRAAHLKLTEDQENTENKEMYETAQTAVESFLSNRAIWDELEYYKEHNVILGKHPIIEKYNKVNEIKALSDIDLANKVRNARSAFSKAKKAVKEAKDDDAKKAAQERFDTWTAELDLLNPEFELRKK